MLRTASTLALVAFVAASASGQCLNRDDIRALGVETLQDDFTIYYSTDHEAYAQRIASQFPGIRDFLQSEFGINPDYAIALLDEDDWNLLRSRKPGCLPPYPSGVNFFDLAVMATPIEENRYFNLCQTMANDLSPAQRDEWALEVGMSPTESCLVSSNCSWLILYGFLLQYSYFNLDFRVNRTFGYVNAGVITAPVMHEVMPALAKSEAALSKWYTKWLTAKYGKPDVREFAEHGLEWPDTDLGRFFGYLHWFRWVGDSLYTRFGSDFAHQLKNLYDSEGLPADLMGYINYYERTLEVLTSEDQGWLESVLTDVEEADELPSSVVLEANYPNPFNPTTRVVYHLPSTTDAVLTLFDMLGRPVRTVDQGLKTAGRHEVAIEATDLPSGIYLLRLDAAGESQVRSISLAR